MMMLMMMIIFKYIFLISLKFQYSSFTDLGKSEFLLYCSLWFKYWSSEVVSLNNTRLQDNRLGRMWTISNALQVRHNIKEEGKGNKKLGCHTIFTTIWNECSLQSGVSHLRKRLYHVNPIFIVGILLPSAFPFSREFGKSSRALVKL